jgi:hypothetical protein
VSSQAADRIRKEAGEYPFSEFQNAYPFEPWMSPSVAERIWLKLSDVEQIEASAAAEIYAQDCRAKGRKVQNAKTWLSERAWEGYMRRCNGSPQPLLKPYSYEWRAFRDHRRERGEDVSFMEERAKSGIGWSVSASERSEVGGVENSQA